MQKAEKTFQRLIPFVNVIGGITGIRSLFILLQFKKV